MQFIAYCGGTKYLPDGMIVGAKVNKVLTNVLKVVYNESTDNFEVAIENPTTTAIRKFNAGELYIGVSVKDICHSIFSDTIYSENAFGEIDVFPKTGYKQHRNWRVNKGCNFLVTDLNRTIIPASDERYAPRMASFERDWFERQLENNNHFGHFYYETPILLVLEYAYGGGLSTTRKASKAVDTGKKFVLET